MVKLAMLGLFLAVTGCDVGGRSGSDVETPSAETDLRAMLPDDAKLVGISIAPDGKRYVLDQHSGLYEVSDSKATLVWNTSGLTGIELTDVVAIDDDHVALTAENDGFLLDLQTHSFASYFCYLPSLPEPETTPMSVSQTLQREGVAVKQRTESVAFNPGTRQLFAQPQTTRLDTNQIAGTELFQFSESGGQPIQVVPLDDNSFVAGGMTTTPDNRLLLGAHNHIYELLPGTTTLRPFDELDPAVDISGMASGPNDELWVLDGASGKLLKR